MKWKLQQEWFEMCKDVCGLKAIEENPEGLENAYKWYVTILERLDFKVELIFNDDAKYRPIIVAVREPGEGYDSYIGFFQHYDVEPIHANWETSPWHLTKKGNRVFGRGISDNIGPFVQRLLVIEKEPVGNGIVFVIQGEEEIGSPFAHLAYPQLKLPNVSLWVEETGYFYKNGNNRVLIIDNKSELSSLIDELKLINSRHGKQTMVRHRPLNKAFGAEKCPCLSHLLKQSPYIAIGPNDDTSKIHGPNESMSLDYLEISALHIKSILNYRSGLDD
tara:strand:+ start:1357 stop:2184 length:828 start_codon:yes stop_codon:yes gene_type:complete